MHELEAWFDRNVLHLGRPTKPYEREPFQLEEGRPISGRIEVYTGHGLQRIGNGKDIWNQYPETRVYWEIANDIAGFDIADLSFNGPEDELNRTENCQLINGTNNVINKRVAIIQRPRLYGKYPKVAAGQSAGAADAAFELGCFGNPNLLSSFRKFAHYKRERGKIFQEAADSSGGKLVVLGAIKRRDEPVSIRQIQALESIGQQTPEFNLSLALDVSDEQIIFGGKIVDINRFMEMIEERHGEDGVKAFISKASSGPFHTELMRAADVPARELLREMKLEDPNGYYVANARKGFETTADGIERDLGDLTTMPVLGRAMDEQINESCRGVIYFIGGKRTIAEDMFPQSAESRRKQIFSTKNIALATGVAVTLGAGGTGIVLGTKAIKNRRRNE